VTNNRASVGAELIRSCYRAVLYNTHARARTHAHEQNQLRLEQDSYQQSQDLVSSTMGLRDYVYFKLSAVYVQRSAIFTCIVIIITTTTTTTYCSWFVTLWQ
jgi:hypothetical protein